MSEVTTLMPALADGQGALLVSLRGLDAWRLYRGGLHPALVLDMFPIVGTLHMTNRSGVESMLRACIDTSPFNDLDAVARYVDAMVDDAPGVVSLEFELQTPYTAEIADLTRLYAIAPPSRNLYRLGTFTSFLTGVGSESSWVVSERYAPVMAGIWFNICDAALTAQQAGTA